jgi:sulfur relay (sulfurtransferase) complex TusBCD TusD component (DsrE family)
VTRRVALLLTDGAASERTATALQLASAVLARGHRVTVFAHDDAATLAAGDGEVARAISNLLRRGVHGGTLDWVVDEAAARGQGVPGCQAPGVVPGGHGDLWAFVREADVVLSPGGGR